MSIRTAAELAFSAPETVPRMLLATQETAAGITNGIVYSTGGQPQQQQNAGIIAYVPSPISQQGFPCFAMQPPSIPAGWFPQSTSYDMMSALWQQQQQQQQQQHYITQQQQCHQQYHLPPMQFLQSYQSMLAAPEQQQFQPEQLLYFIYPSQALDPSQYISQATPFAGQMSSQPMQISTHGDGDNLFDLPLMTSNVFLAPNPPATFAPLPTVSAAAPRHQPQQYDGLGVLVDAAAAVETTMLSAQQHWCTYEAIAEEVAIGVEQEVGMERMQKPTPTQLRKSSEMKASETENTLTPEMQLQSNTEGCPTTQPAPSDATGTLYPEQESDRALQASAVCTHQLFAALETPPLHGGSDVNSVSTTEASSTAARREFSETPPISSAAVGVVEACEDTMEPKEFAGNPSACISSHEMGGAFLLPPSMEAPLPLPPILTIIKVLIRSCAVLDSLSCIWISSLYGSWLTIRCASLICIRLHVSQPHPRRPDWAHVQADCEDGTMVIALVQDFVTASRLGTNN